MSARDPIEKLADAAAEGRLRATFVDLLDGEPFSRLREWSESLAEIADAVDEARDAIETWTDQEDRELRAEARDDACGAIERLVDVWNGSPLDVSKLEDWEPPEDDG